MATSAETNAWEKLANQGIGFGAVIGVLGMAVRSEIVFAFGAGAVAISLLGHALATWGKKKESGT